MAVDNSRRPAYDLHDHPPFSQLPSRLQQQNPSRQEPADGDASQTGVDGRQPRSAAPAAAVTRAHSSDGNLRIGATAAAPSAGDVRRPYDSDLETESAYQQATWDRIQQWRREIMQMRTPKRDGITPARSYQDIHRRQLQRPEASDDGVRGNHGLPLTGRSGIQNGGEPANYVKINRRQVAQSNYNRRSVIHPPKTYSEIFAKKKESETTYGNVAKKNGKCQNCGTMLVSLEMIITACPAGQCSVNGDIVFLWERVNFDQL
jgi:hypothetical protein